MNAETLFCFYLPFFTGTLLFCLFWYSYVMPEIAKAEHWIHLKICTYLEVHGMLKKRVSTESWKQRILKRILKGLSEFWHSMD